MFAQAFGRLADMSAEACDALRKLLDAENESVRLGAIRAAIELGGRMRESVDLEQRVAALESQAKGKPHGRLRVAN